MIIMIVMLVGIGLLLYPSVANYWNQFHQTRAIMAYNEGDVGLHAPIRLRVTKTFDGVEMQKVINTTVGRIIFNEPIPQDLGFVDRSDPEHAFDYEIDFRVDKKKLGDIISRCIHKHGFTISAEVLDNIKAQGYKYSTKSGMTQKAEDRRHGKEDP